MASFSGRISTEAVDVYEERDDEVGHPPYRSPGVPSIVKTVMRGDELVLEVELPPDKLQELAEASGGELNIRIVPKREA